MTCDSLCSLGVIVCFRMELQTLAKPPCLLGPNRTPAEPSVWVIVTTMESACGSKEGAGWAAVQPKLRHDGRRSGLVDVGVWRGAEWVFAVLAWAWVGHSEAGVGSGPPGKPGVAFPPPRKRSQVRTSSGLEDCSGHASVDRPAFDLTLGGLFTSFSHRSAGPRGPCWYACPL